MHPGSIPVGELGILENHLKVTKNTRRERKHPITSGCIRPHQDFFKKEKIMYQIDYDALLQRVYEFKMTWVAKKMNISHPRLHYIIKHIHNINHNMLVQLCNAVEFDPRDCVVKIEGN